MQLGMHGAWVSDFPMCWNPGIHTLDSGTTLFPHIQECHLPDGLQVIKAACR